MRWTLGLLLLTTPGCYRNTRMVACPENGCPHTVARTSPEGLPYRGRPAPPPPVTP